MISDGEFVTKTSKGEELDEKKAPGRTGAERTGKLRLRACYFELCGHKGFEEIKISSFTLLEHGSKTEFCY